MTVTPSTQANQPQVPPAVAALGFVFGVGMLGFVAMLSGIALA